MQKTTLESAATHAIASYPQESCGLVVVVKGKEQYVACRNKAADPSEHFVLDPEDYVEADDRGEIIAIVHSHPDAPARPSEADRVSCEATGLTWHILSIGKNEGEAPYLHATAAIEPSGYVAPLVGREFHHGILDCYTLVRDYYQQEMNITLKDYELADGWWERGENLYMKNLEDCGFYQVSEREIKVGDMILMQIRSNEPNHAGVYLGDGLFLHHLYGRLSSRDVYGGYWRDATRFVVRHKDAK